MAHSSNSEPRRFWKARHHSARDRRCTACGGRASFHGGDIAFCNACLEWARQTHLSEGGDFGSE
jgi:hypothetical protein